nr:MAG TPA: hypothetical protein [Caudoviricetes sp.]DAN57607.1 MAG TPA: hypothetical protein [Bacteriophage sp.]
MITSQTFLNKVGLMLYQVIIIMAMYTRYSCWEVL